VPSEPSLKFSIVTPSYKQLSWLKLCIASVADQEGVSVEHIIQDAQSGPELEEWVRQNSKAQLYVERDAGMYDAINRGLKRAKGEICAYLNCDEQYFPGALARVADYFERHPEVDIVFGDGVLTDPVLKPLSYRRVVVPRLWHTMVRPLGVLSAAMFFRRKIVDDNILFDPAWKGMGDKVWLVTLLKRGYRLGILSEPLAVFALTGANLSFDKRVVDEHRRWDQQVPLPIRLGKPLFQVHYMFEKWRHGAYSNRGIDSAWYTLDSLPKRQNFTQAQLGWNWPIISNKAP
jgi:glycosyltransferase involved in cell wall biosynthesis